MKLVFLCAAFCLGATASRDPLGPDSSPAYLLLGEKNGEIRRCLVDAPTTCELFHKGNSTVTQTLLHDEHLYASHDDGTILKCGWYGNEPCQAIYHAGTFVNSLTVAGGYLFAGGDDKQLVRCRLASPHTCETVLTFDRRITSLYSLDKYIYVGTDRYLSRCPKGVDMNCTQIASSKNEFIKGISGTNTTIIFLEYTNGVWTYNTPSTKLNFIKSNTFTCDHMAYFEGNIYLIHYWQVIEKCNWDENGLSNCSDIIKHKDQDIRSMSFVYGARHLRKEYLHQDNWQQQQTEAVYEDTMDHRGLMEMQVLDGKLCDARGVPVDTRVADAGRAVFAMGPDGRLLLSTSQHHAHTASFFNGLPVAGAGEMVVEEGVIRRIKACSQHYRVDVELNRQVENALRSKGYVQKIELEPCLDTNDQTNQDVEQESNNINNYR